MIDERRYLLGLIRQGEHQQQDFKYRVEDARKLARSVSAFANTDGGRLLIGVRDDGHLSGVRSDEEIYMMQQAAMKYCRPAASITFDTYHVAADINTAHPTTQRSKLRTIVVCTVPPSTRKPVFALDDDDRPRAYIRIADENIVASPVHLAIWREEMSPRGQLITYSQDEQKLMAVLERQPWQTLNQIVRRAALPRHRVVAMLAQFIRFGLAEWRADSHRFVFSISPP